MVSFIQRSCDLISCESFLCNVAVLRWGLNPCGTCVFVCERKREREMEREREREREKEKERERYSWSSISDLKG